MTAKLKLRDGDWVEIVVPRFVTRVGYPKTLDDYKKDIEEKQCILLSTLLSGYQPGHRRDLAKQRIVHELAYLAAKDDGFGGRERSLHFEDHPELQGRLCQVYGVVTRMTGTYYPPCTSRGWGYGGYEEEYEPGGLANQKCHRLLRISVPGSFESFKHKPRTELLIQPENVSAEPDAKVMK